jgi:hypothetical protein
MASKRTAAFLRAFGKPVLAGALVLFLFLSALASASPALHHWLHEDHQAPSHYCIATVLEHGHGEMASPWVSVMPAVPEMPVSALPCESFFITHDISLYPERGPPLLS